MHHYYASCVYGWVTADTRDKALKKLAADIGASIIKRHKPIAVVCKVELPEAAHYTISEYMPNKITKEDGVNETRQGEPVPIAEVENLRIISVSGKTGPI